MHIGHTNRDAQGTPDTVAAAAAASENTEQERDCWVGMENPGGGKDVKLGIVVRCF